MSDLILQLSLEEIIKALLMFSKACEYGISASTYIALQSLENKRVSLVEIAKEIDSPVAFTAKILQQLSKNQIIDSVKVATRGFEIQRSNIDSIKLSEIVHAIYGDKVFIGCGLGLKKCNADHPCPVHKKLIQIRDNLKHVLENTSLYEMTVGL